MVLTLMTHWRTRLEAAIDKLLIQSALVKVKLLVQEQDMVGVATVLANVIAVVGLTPEQFIEVHGHLLES